MLAYRTASFFRVAVYLRIRGEKSPLGFFFVRNINPIKEDLLDLRIVPTAQKSGFLIHFEDHDCTKLPNEIRYMDPISAKGLCQFIVENVRHTRLRVPKEEQPIWTTLFDKINYRIDFTTGSLQLKGITPLNGYNLNI